MGYVVGVALCWLVSACDGMVERNLFLVGGLRRSSAMVHLTGEL